VYVGRFFFPISEPPRLGHLHPVWGVHSNVASPSMFYRASKGLCVVEALRSTHVRGEDGSEMKKILKRGRDFLMLPANLDLKLRA